MPYKHLDRKLEPELFFTMGLFRKIPGFDESGPKKRYGDFVLNLYDYPHLLNATIVFYDSHPEFVDSLSREYVRNSVEGLKSRLSDREQITISLRYGLEDGKVLTLEETSRILSERGLGPSIPVKGERVRHIEVKALRKLGRTEEAKDLYQYLESLAERLK